MRFLDLAVTLALPLLLVTETTVAADEGFGDFGDTGSFEVESDKPGDEPKAWRLQAAYNLGYGLAAPRDINVHRGELRLQWERLLNQKYFVELDGKLIGRLQGDQALAAGESFAGDTKLRSLYVQTSNPRWGIKAGYQVASFGKLDMMPVVDVMSPWDYSEFAFTAPEDARVSQAMLRLSHHRQQDKFELLWNPKPSANHYPGGDPSTLLETYLGTSNFDLQITEPWENNQGELALRWERNGEKRDVSLTVASVLQDDPLVEPIDLLLPTPLYGIRYPRYQLLGAGFTRSSGNFLWKLDAAYLHELSFFDTAYREANGVHVAGGFDYVSPNQVSVSVEAGHRHLLLPGGSTLPADSTQLGFRVSRNFRNDTLSAIYFASYQLQDRYLAQSGALRYAISDNISAELVATVFNVGNTGSMYAFTDGWDQLAFRLTVAQ